MNDGKLKYVSIPQYNAFSLEYDEFKIVFKCSQDRYIYILLEDISIDGEVCLKDKDWEGYQRIFEHMERKRFKIYIYNLPISLREYLIDNYNIAIC